MPYNLRKRKEPPVAEQKPVELVEKKPRGRAKKLKTNDVDVPSDKDTSTKPATKRQKSTKEQKPLVEAEPIEDEQINEQEEALKVQPVEETKAVIAEKKDKKPKLDGSNQLVFGSDLGGELGLCKIGIDKKNPTPVSINETIRQVACGGMHTLSLTESGKVYSYGCNDDGALGRVTDGDEKLESTPTIVNISDKVLKISAGDSHGAALTDKSEVLIWGNFRDENGMVGLMPESEGKATFQPTRVKLDKKLKDIASGANHMLLLDTDGVVYSFGVGDHGQLGRLKPEECAKKLNSDTSEIFLIPKPVCLKNVDPQRPFVCDAIFAGEYTSFATNTDKKKNRLAGWGLNNYYQLGYKGQKGQLDQHYPRRCTFTCSTSMINVSGGQHHTIFLTKTGRVYAAGRHEYGMLGIGDSMKDKKEICPAKPVEGFDSPVKTICTGSRTSFAVSNEGKLYSWGMSSLNLGVDGDNDLTEPTLVKKLVDKVVTSVSSGSITSVIVE